MPDRSILPVLDTPRLLLRAWEEADAPAMHECFGDAETMRFWDTPPSRNLAETLDRIQASLDVSPRWHAAFAVTIRATGRVVGMVNYHGRQPTMRRLVVGWIVSPAWRRRGVTLEAMSALLDHCHSALNTHRVEAEIEPENAASIGLAEKLGFQREGLMRECMFVGGQPRSLYLYARLHGE